MNHFLLETLQKQSETIESKSQLINYVFFATKCCVNIVDWRLVRF